MTIECSIHHPKMTLAEVENRIREIEDSLDYYSNFSTYSDHPTLLNELSELQGIRYSMGTSDELTD